MTSRSREWVFRMAAVVGSVLLFVLLLEGILRLIEPREVMRYFFVQSDNVLHHKFIPLAKGRFKTASFDTHYEIDSLGLRDREYPEEKPVGKERILMLGDSFTEGIGVEASETFSKVLEGFLDDSLTRGKYEVINSGVGSYSPLLEYLYLQNGGLKLSPDVVVLNLDLSDMYDDIQYTRLARYGRDSIPVGVSPEPRAQSQGWISRAVEATKDFLRDNTRLYNFLTLRLGRYSEAAQHEGTGMGNLLYDKYAMLRPGYTYREQDWVLTHRYLLLIRDLLKARGVRFCVAVYPYGQQVSPTEFGQGRQFWGFRTDTVYPTQPQQWAEDFCRANGIDVINACEDFRNAARRQSPLYIDDNGHWTAAGHRVFAGVLFQEMKKRGLL